MHYSAHQKFLEKPHTEGVRGVVMVLVPCSSYQHAFVYVECDLDFIISLETETSTAILSHCNALKRFLSHKSTLLREQHHKITG